MRHSFYENLSFLCRRLGFLKSIDTRDVKRLVFILSTGRVGSQTLASLLRLSKNNFSYHEPNPLLYKLSCLNYMNGFEKGSCEISGEAFAISRKSLFLKSLVFNKGYIETSPQVTFLAPAILKLLPNVKFVHLHRDPRLVVRSGMRRNWYAGHPADCTRIVPRVGSDWYDSWSTFSPFQRNCWLWAETNSWICDFLSAVPESQKLILCSERLFSAEESVISELFQFVESPLPKKEALENVLGEKLNAQKLGMFPMPTEWDAKMNEELISIVGSTAQQLGYELN